MHGKDALTSHRTDKVIGYRAGCNGDEKNWRIVSNLGWSKLPDQNGGR